jgi:hypothetical protein
LANHKHGFSRAAVLGFFVELKPDGSQSIPERHERNDRYKDRRESLRQFQ